MPLVVVGFFGMCLTLREDDPPAVPRVVSLVFTTIAGLLGWGAERLNRPIPFLTGFSALSFPFYVFHQTVLVLLGFWLLGWSDAPLAKFLAIAALSLGISLALARAAGLTRATRLMFGMRG